MSPTEAPTKRSRIAAGGLFGLNVGLVILLMLIVGGIIWFERGQVIGQAERNAGNLVDVLAAQTRENFQAIDQSLLAIAERLDIPRVTED